jgi:hypothetical protein
MVSLVTDATDQVVETTVRTAVEPVVETVGTETETVGDTPEPTTAVAGDTTSPEADAEPETVADEAGTTAEALKPVRPVKVDPAARIRQGIKNFRTGLHNTAKKLTGRGPSSRPDSRSESSPSDSAASESPGAKDAE